MKRRFVILPAVVGAIFLFLGMGVGAAMVAFVPDPGSTPAIFDDFRFSSTSNGYWHVNAIGASATIKHSILDLRGASIELDHRIQTDPATTVVALKIRATKFHKFGLGLGVYHAGTIGMEFDDDGIKCGRATDQGYRVDILQGWKVPPVHQWFYLEMDVHNPYPDEKSQRALAKLGNVDFSQLKKVTITCSAYDQNKHLIAWITPKDPPANTHYAALDEAFMRTWDSQNDYQVDWLYAGPQSGNPLNSFPK